MSRSKLVSLRPFVCSSCLAGARRPTSVARTAFHQSRRLYNDDAAAKPSVRLPAELKARLKNVDKRVDELSRQKHIDRSFPRWRGHAEADPLSTTEFSRRHAGTDPDGTTLVTVYGTFIRDLIRTFIARSSH